MTTENKAEAEKIDSAEVLRDLIAWMKRHLESLHARQNPLGYLADGKTEGYSVAEIPDWELRQKLEATQALLDFREKDVRELVHMLERCIPHVSHSVEIAISGSMMLTADEVVKDAAALVRKFKEGKL